MTEAELNDVLRARIFEAFKDWVAEQYGDQSKGVAIENAAISRDPTDESAYIVNLDIPAAPHTVRARVTVGPGNEISVRS